MKFLLTLILGSLGLSAGGVVMLYVNEHNIFNFQVWSFAITGLLTAPGFMFEQAISGQSPELIRGLLAALIGAAAAMTFAAVALMTGALQSMKSARKSSRARKAEKKEERKVSVSKDVSQESGKAGPGFWARAVEKLAATRANRRKARGGFDDVEAALDEEAAVAKPSLMTRLKERFGGARSKSKTLVIKSGTAKETIVEIQDDTGFEADLKQWYLSIKHVPQNDPVKISEAKALVARANKRARSRVTDEDAMNGEFMLRMMDAWASKKRAVSGVPSTPIVMSNVDDMLVEDDTLTRAIQDIVRDGVRTASDEDDFALDDVDDERDDFIIQDIEDKPVVPKPSFDDVVEVSDDDAFDLPDEDKDGGEEGAGIGEPVMVDEGIGLRALKVAGHILRFLDKADEVARSEGEWEDEHADPAMRQADVEEMFAALTAALETEEAEIRQLSTFDEEDDAREIEWLQQAMNDIDSARAAALVAAAVDVEDKVEVEDEDADLEASFGIPSSSSEPAETGYGSTEYDDDFMGSASDDSGYEDPEGNDDHAEEAGAPVATSLDGEAGSEIEETLSVEQSPHEPRNVGLAELDEMAMSGEIVYNWGLIAKSAGAAEAKLSHSVIAKEGLRRRVVGIMHLVSAWRGKEKEESRRLSIILRYVPEGEWTLVMDDFRANGIKMVDTHGDFVQISAELLGQHDSESGVLLIHFYGPGATGSVYEESENLIVTNATLSVEQIRDKMVG